MGNPDGIYLGINERNELVSIISTNNWLFFILMVFTMGNEDVIHLVINEITKINS